MAQKKKQLNLEPGKKYRGSFWVNEFGEFQCHPEQKGTNPQGLKLQKEGEQFKLFTSKNTIRVVITLDKADTDENVNNFTNACTEAAIILATYEFT